MTAAGDSAILPPDPPLDPVSASPALTTIAPVPTVARGRRAIATWVFGAVYTFSTMVIGIATTPILLRLLGNNRIGAMRVSGDWLGYAALFDFGISPALGVFIMRAQAKGNAGEVAALARRGVGILLILTGVALPVGCALSWLMPRLVAVPAGMESELRWGSLIATAGLLAAPFLVFRSVLETGQRGYLIQIALLIQSLLVTGCGLAFAFLGAGMKGQAIAGLMGTVVFSALMFRFANRIAPVKNVASATLGLSDLAAVGWPLFLLLLGNRASLMTDSIITGYRFGSADVAALVMTQRIISLFGIQVNNLINSSWAGLSDLLHKGEIDIFTSRIAELLRLIVSLGVVLTGTVAAYNGHFVRLWVGPALYGGDLLSFMTVVATVVFGFVCLFTWILDVMGHARRHLLVSLLGAAVKLVVSFIAMRWMGLAGVAFGTIVGYLLTDAWYCPLLLRRIYGIPLAPIGKAVMRGLMFGVPWTVGVWLLTRTHVPPHRWVGLLGEGAVVGAAAVGYCWAFVLTSDERIIWRKRLSRRANLA